MIWFSLLVLIPLAAIVVTAGKDGWQGYVDILKNPQTWAAIKLTVGQSALVTLLNVVMGTLIAWVLVRDKFWGRGILDVLIDIPFAMPTIVAGLVLLGLYGPKSPLGINVANERASVTLALAFVTLPFIVRTVQPVLAELDTDVEEAAASLGARRLTILRRLVLPVAGAGHRGRGCPVVRPRHLGVRLPGAAERHAPLQDGGRLGAGLQLRRGR